MMKNLILLAGMLTFARLEGQTGKNAATTGDFTYTHYFKWQYPWMETFLDGKKLKELRFRETVKGEESDAFYFNEKGLPVKAVYNYHQENNLRRRATRTHEYTYTEQGQLAEARHYGRKGKFSHSTKWTYYAPKQLLSIQRQRKHKLYSETLFGYNSDSTLAKNENFRYKRGVKRLQSYYAYTYDNDRQLKTTRFYKKNKLAHTWNFACDDRGKLIKKDTTSVCTSEGSDSRGRKIVTKYTTNTKKRSTKTVYYYTRINNSDVLSQVDNYVILKGREVIVYTLHEPDSVEAYHVYKLYNNKAEVILLDSTAYFKYNRGIGIIQSKARASYNKKGKTTFSRRENFNDKGLPVTCVLTGRNNREFGRIEYVYKDAGEFTVNHYRKSRLKRSYKAAISYY